MPGYCGILPMRPPLSLLTIRAKAGTNLLRPQLRCRDGPGNGGRMRFLLVEDAADLTRSVQDLLRLNDHAVNWPASLAAARDCLAFAF